MIVENIERRMDAASLLVEEGVRPGVRNIKKSALFRSAITLLATVVEAMVFEFVKKHTKAPDHVIDTYPEHVEFGRVSGTLFKRTNNVLFCEKLPKQRKITDEGVGFGKLNVFLKNKELVSEALYSELEWVRKERNRLHMQSLSEPDTGYTMGKINRINAAITDLTPIR